MERCLQLAVLFFPVKEPLFLVCGYQLCAVTNSCLRASRVSPPHGCVCLQYTTSAQRSVWVLCCVLNARSGSLCRVAVVVCCLWCRHLVKVGSGQEVWRPVPGGVAVVLDARQVVLFAESVVAIASAFAQFEREGSVVRRRGMPEVHLYIVGTCIAGQKRSGPRL